MYVYVGTCDFVYVCVCVCFVYGMNVCFVCMWVSRVLSMCIVGVFCSSVLSSQ
jgi:hypothetical protein